MNLMIVPGIFVCSSFQISVCMLIVSKALLISNATMVVRAGGAIWLNTWLRFCLMCVVRHGHQVRLNPELLNSVFSDTKFYPECAANPYRSKSKSNALLIATLGYINYKLSQM